MSILTSCHLPIPRCLPSCFSYLLLINSIKGISLEILSEIVELVPALTSLQGKLRTKTFKLASIETSQTILACNPSCVRPGTLNVKDYEIDITDNVTGIPSATVICMYVYICICVSL